MTSDRRSRRGCKRELASIVHSPFPPAIGPGQFSFSAFEEEATCI